MKQSPQPARLRAYLVDDEPLAVRRLTRLLEATGRAEIAGSTTDPEDAAAFLNSHTVDVLFLDIQMPGMNGFELLACLDHQPLVVFTTAFDQYALKAFEVNSIDYLLKPIEPRQLDRALAKLERLGAGTRQQWAERRDMSAMLEELSRTLRGAQPDYPSRIASRLGGRIVFIDLARVTHFFAQDKLTYATSDGRNYCIDRSVTELERKLDPRKFLRIHRSTLLNLEWVKEVDAWFAGGAVVRLKDEKGTELSVARDRVRTLKEHLGF
jgi:two-component system, LytTR family, response regulator